MRAAGALLLAALSATGCASTQTEMAAAPVKVEEAPIDPNDPLGVWVPHIREASRRFDMPEPWIRAVMLRESGGRAVVNGKAITSPAGAIGLMQVMPGTYGDLRDAYGLGPDPTNPRDNILAGTAYLREMYDLFGAPGFLAAYNCGPACYASHLAGKHRLPRETRLYLAALSPSLNKAEPRERPQSENAVIEVAVVPDAPPPPAAKPATPAAATPGTVQLAAAPPLPAPEPKPDLRSEPAVVLVADASGAAGRVPGPAQASLQSQAPVQFAAVAPPEERPAAKPPKAAAAGWKTNHAPAPAQDRTLVAEAVLPPDATTRGERVIIRFVSQRSNGCGSLQGRDRICVIQAAEASDKPS